MHRVCWDDHRSYICRMPLWIHIVSILARLCATQEAKGGEICRSATAIAMLFCGGATAVWANGRVGASLHAMEHATHVQDSHILGAVVL